MWKHIAIGLIPILFFVVPRWWRSMQEPDIGLCIGHRHGQIAAGPSLLDLTPVTPAELDQKISALVGTGDSVMIIEPSVLDDAGVVDTLNKYNVDVYRRGW